MIIEWPDYCVSSFRWSSAEQAIVFKSMFGSQALGVASPLWQVEMTGVPTLWPASNEIETFIESIRGYTNQIALWNLAQPVPRGTMRGTLRLVGQELLGSTSLQITGGAAGSTLLKGDLLGLGSTITQQVVRVMADATADGSGNISVTIGTPLRNTFPAATPIIWNKPKALFRQATLADGIQYQPKFGQPWAMSLLESWLP